MQTITGNGKCLCSEGFVDDTCQCANPTTFSPAPVVCTRCPYGYNGTNCSLCPGTIFNANASIAAVCSAHGVCTTSEVGASSSQPTCNCTQPYMGPSCTDCQLGYANATLRTQAGDSDLCLPCPGLLNSANAGPWSGGAVVSSCYYKGVCVAAGSDVDEATTVCVDCSRNWGGVNCCTWSGTGIGVITFMLIVTVAVLVLTTSVLMVGGIRTTVALLLFMPTFQVRGIMCNNRCCNLNSTITP